MKVRECVHQRPEIPIEAVRPLIDGYHQQARTILQQLLQLEEVLFGKQGNAALGHESEKFRERAAVQAIAMLLGERPQCADTALSNLLDKLLRRRQVAARLGEDGPGGHEPFFVLGVLDDHGVPCGRRGESLVGVENQGGVNPAIVHLREQLGRGCRKPMRRPRRPPVAAVAVKVFHGSTPSL